MPGFGPEANEPIAAEFQAATPASTKTRVFALGNIGCSGACRCGEPCNTKICVAVCGAGQVVGATVSIYSGAILISSGTTTAPLGGCVNLPIPSPGSYTVQIAAPGFAVNTSTQTLACDGTVTISIGNPPAGGACCGSAIILPCNYIAIPTTLYLTDSQTTLPLTYSPVQSGQWIGCYACTVGSGATVIGPPSALGCTAGGSTCTITYYLSCFPENDADGCQSGAPVPNMFQVERVWNLCADALGNCYYCSNPTATSSSGYLCTPTASGEQAICDGGTYDYGCFIATSCYPLMFSGDLLLGTAGPATGCNNTLSSPLGPSISVSS
jgi:hypothetical protein